jgi:hypothetical protein
LKNNHKFIENQLEQNQEATPKRLKNNPSSCMLSKSLFIKSSKNGREESGGKKSGIINNSRLILSQFVIS